MPGGADKSYGIQVARLAGLPKEILDRAKEILAQLEKPDGAIAPPPKAKKRSTRLRQGSGAAEQSGEVKSEKPQMDLL